MRAVDHPSFIAIEGLLLAVGGNVVEPADIAHGDIPILWENEVIGAVRLGSLSDALERMVAHIEAELGAPLSGLSRSDKQRAVHMLEERGAFLLRKSVDDVAERMGVSRITVYNYLAAIREQ